MTRSAAGKLCCFAHYPWLFATKPDSFAAYRPFIVI